MGDIALKRFQLALEGGFTSGAASVYNGGSPVVATRRMAVDQKIDLNAEPVYEKPLEARGSYAGMYTHILHQWSAKGKIPTYVYADDLCYLLRMVVSGTPTIATLPTTPTALLAATAIAATMSLTTQPNATADGAVSQILAVTLSNTSATSSAAVTITITGTDIYGRALVEAVAFTAGTATPSAVGGGTGALTCTLYTKNYFATVGASGIATSAQPANDQVAVAGVDAFLWTFSPDMGVAQGGSTLYSATAEYYDGSAAWQMPGMVGDKFTFTSDIGKSFKADLGFVGQKKVLLSAGTGSINPAATQGAFQALQNLSDNIISAIPTYTTRFYSDSFGSVPGTTAINARLTHAKWDVDSAAKLGKAADGTPYPTFVARTYYGDKTTLEATLLFNSGLAGTYDPVDVSSFFLGNSRTIQLAYPGVALPCGVLNVAENWPTNLQVGGVGGYYGISYSIAGRFIEMKEKDVEGRQAFDFKLESEVELSYLTVPFQIQIVSRINPNMV
jgi:hypothetical protein